MSKQTNNTETTPKTVTAKTKATEQEKRAIQMAKREEKRAVRIKINGVQARITDLQSDLTDLVLLHSEDEDFGTRMAEVAKKLKAARAEMEVLTAKTVRPSAWTEGSDGALVRKVELGKVKLEVRVDAMNSWGVSLHAKDGVKALADGNCFDQAEAKRIGVTVAKAYIRSINKR